MAEHELILASGSPRRKQLLSDLGFEFTVRTADVDETSMPGERPGQLANRLALSKANAVAGSLEASSEPRLIVAADTVVALGDQIYGKPQDSADAERMLTSLRGKWHQVHSAVCVLNVQEANPRVSINTTQVQMRDYAMPELLRYIQSGDPLDKAGAYAIQNQEFAPVSAIEGCLTGVMGLPLGELCSLLAEHGVEPRCSLVDVCESHTDFRCCQRTANHNDPRHNSIDT